jgi:hypothetical protein
MLASDPVFALRPLFSGEEFQHTSGVLRRENAGTHRKPERRANSGSGHFPVAGPAETWLKVFRTICRIAKRHLYSIPVRLGAIIARPAC